MRRLSAFNHLSSYKIINKSTAAIRVREIQIDESSQIAHFLIRYSDKNIADPVFEKLDTGELRTEPKLEGEGISVSAHLSVSINENSNNTYLAIFEDVPGITRAKIQRILNSEFKIICKNYTYKDKNKKIKKYRPLATINGYASEKLKDDLAKGRLTGIELVKFKKKGDFDEEEFIKEDSEIIKMKTVKKIAGIQAIAGINRLLTKVKSNDFDQLRIKYTKDGVKNFTQEISPKQEDAGEVLLTKCEHFKTIESLPQCSESIISTITTKTKALILNQRAKNAEISN